MKYLNLEEYLVEKDIEKEELIKHIKTKTKNTTFISGSLAQGHGTLTSDVDVNVVVGSLDEDFSIENIYFNGIRIDIETISETTLSKLSSTLGDFSSESDSKQYYSTEIDGVNIEKLVHFAGRCINGEHVIINDHMKFILEQLSDGRLKVWMSEFYKWLVHAYIEDVTGFIASEDYAAAYTSMLDALHYGLMSFLNATGTYIDRTKWVSYNLNKNHQELFEFYQHYLASEPSELIVLDALDFVENLIFS